MQIIAHRGASADAPENTLAAVQLAWRQNADAVEIDVHLTKDGRIVVCHDETTKRTGGPDRNIADQTLAELKTLDVGLWKGRPWAGQRIPTLAEVLETVPQGKRLFIEIKCGGEIIPELKRVLKESGKTPRQTAVIGVSDDVMKSVKRELPAVKVYWVISRKQDTLTQRWKPDLTTILRRAKLAALDAVDLSDRPPLNKDDVTRFKEAGLEVYVWTVNTLPAARRLQQAGVNGLTTDRPGWLRERLGGQ